MKTLTDVLRTDANHWVGDGFPVRSIFSYHREAKLNSPFLLFDLGGPVNFEPTTRRRGVGQHPHRGFETVTIVFDGEVSHRDSAGNGGTIGPGEVQWMTAGAGIVHEEYHSAGFARTGGPFRMVQLWVNLRAADKGVPPRYQALTADTIPTVTLEGGIARVVAGELHGTVGPARTFSPINVWDVRLERDAEVHLPLPAGHTSLIAVIGGAVTIDGEQLREAEIARLTRDGEGVAIRADSDAIALVLTGEPFDEPVVGHGPFVMNTHDEIRQAIVDFNAGRFGATP